MLVSVADCERNQAEWNAAVAVAGGGEVWEDCGLRWSWQAHDRQLMLNFPRSIDAAAARRGVDAAGIRNACIVGAWLGSDVDASGLETVGFERGWEPWWMAAPAAGGLRASARRRRPGRGPTRHPMANGCIRQRGLSGSALAARTGTTSADGYGPRPVNARCDRRSWTPLRHPTRGVQRRRASPRQEQRLLYLRAC